MSDTISIPGVSSKYDTKKLIEELMKVERVPKTTAEAALKKSTEKKTVWLELNTQTVKLRDSSRAMFSFQNPFSKRVAKSANEDVLTATASREALEEIKSIQVKQIAEADRFLSANLSKDYKVPKGNYVFKVGEKSVSFKFIGGSLRDFAEALTRNGKDLIRGNVISVTKDSQSIAIESLKTGLSNKLSFEEDSVAFAMEAGIAEKITTKRRDIALSDASLQRWDKPLSREKVLVKDGVLNVLSEGEVKIPISPPAKAEGELSIEFEASVKKRPETVYIAPLAPPGPQIGEVGSIIYEGIVVENAASEVPLPSWEAPPPPVVKNDMSIFFVGSGELVLPLPESTDGSGFAKFQYKISDLGGEVGSLLIRNNNSYRDIELRNLRILDPNESGGMRALRPISTARDALLSMDGIEVERDSNAVSDLIPGVTLTLHDSTEKPVKLSIEPDREAAKDAIISWVGTYNQLIGKINILTRNDEKVIQEIDYLTEEEKKTAKERLGLFMGDSMLSHIQTSLQRIASDVYETSMGRGMALLAQIGISTDARKPGTTAGYDASKLRGYLDIDEDTLTKSLQTGMVPVKQLFGNDTDGDLIINTGVAYKVDELLKPYVETGGLYATRTRTLDSDISAKEREIESLDKKLASKQAEYERKYGQMEGSLNAMQGDIDRIKNFSTQNSTNK